MAVKFEEAIRKALDEGTALNAAAIAVDKTGKVIYNQAFGHSDVETKKNDVTADSVMWFASNTKLVTAIASLQLVEQGLLKLDEPISNVLSEFKETTVLTAYDEATNTPTTEPAPRAPTLRELLTHSSGTVYALMHPLLGAYLTHHLGRPASATNNNITYSHSHPSAFAPGTSWSYSPGLEWAGIAVAQVSQSDNLSDYIQRHIFEPLGMNSSTFHPTRRPEIMARMTHMPMRDPTSGKLVPNTSGMWPIIDPEDDFGGAGMYSCASDYIKLLTSLLLNDGKVLKPETVDNVLFRPCLSAESKAAMNGMFAGPFASFLAPGYPIASDAVVYDYAPGGAVLVNGAKGLAGKGTLYWAGLPNSDWFIDRERGIAGIYATHLLPPGDGPSQELYRQWHEEIYAMGGQ